MNIQIFINKKLKKFSKYNCQINILKYDLAFLKFFQKIIVYKAYLVV
jgi:hypothetical protein